MTGASIVWSTLAGGTIGTGTTFSTTVLPVGSFRVYLTVTDSKGLSAQTYRTVTIRPSSNQSPVATLTAPTNGSSVVQGTSVSFAGSAADPERRFYQWMIATIIAAVALGFARSFLLRPLFPTVH